MKMPSDFPRPKQRVPLWAVLAAIPVVLFAVGFIAMLTFGAIANEFGASSAPGFWGSLGIAAGLSAVFSSGTSRTRS